MMDDDARPRILCVHQGGELYGSDRSFLQAVEALRAGWPTAWLRVVLAVDGPLRPLLANFANEVIVRNLAVLRLAHPITTVLKGTVALPWYFCIAARDIARADLVYINTTVIADYMLAARLAPDKTVIHAREIPKAKAVAIINGLVRASGASVIFNSQATARAFSLPPSQRATVVHNGVATVQGASSSVLPQAFTPDRPLRVLMLGRINDWKGQDLLIESVARLPEARRSLVRLRIVGSTFMDAREPIEALERQIAAARLEAQVILEPFQESTDSLFRWSDLCVMPSRQPEPFGRVAIEAMAHARPVIAAAHGGLTEIIEDGRSGWLVSPNDVNALTATLDMVLADPTDLARRGACALTRFNAHFSTATMSAHLLTVLRDWVPALTRPH